MKNQGNFVSYADYVTKIKPKNVEIKVGLAKKNS